MNLKELVAKKSELIALKKAEIKLCKGGISGFVTASGAAEKSTSEKLVKSIVGNTYWWYDSHGDVHADGTFTKSLKERKNIFHLVDHDFKLTAKVGEPIEVREQQMEWKALGVDIEGTTTALVMDSEIVKEYNERIYNDYKAGRINQHSVGMQYVKIDLAVNDEDEEEEYKVWQDNIGKIANREVVEKEGFFWLVREAKLIEISAVLMGSNPITPTLEAAKSTSETTEPSNDTQKTELFFKTLLNKN
jgi:phage head maturation protease